VGLQTVSTPALYLPEIEPRFLGRPVPVKKMGLLNFVANFEMSGYETMSVTKVSRCALLACFRARERPREPELSKLSSRELYTGVGHQPDSARACLKRNPIVRMQPAP
jgi:hypothetical protein